MSTFNRRGVLAVSAMLGSAPLGPAAQASTSPATAAPPGDVTRRLAQYVVGAKATDLPVAVRKEARRTLLNYIGCAVGGSAHETVDIAVRALAPFSGPARASLLGRRERFDILHAALINGIASHVFDFDDTHLKTIIHPGGPVISAILALAEQQPVSGSEFLNALVLGVEAECRIGNAVYPDHYDTGWHITGTAGVFGAAAAAGKLLGLDRRRMAWALGLAATQPVGLREMFGTMTKSFHPGRAAQNGLTAALLAQAGFTSSEQALEAPRGWAPVVSTKRDYEEITRGLGATYEIALNTYKPFACGIVIHPAIDAALQLRREHGLIPDQIERIDLRVHPLVLELTGKKRPQVGLEGKFSVYHSVAVAMVEGAAGPRQYTDRAVRDPAVVALRGRVLAAVDPTVREEQVRMVMVLKDGRKLEKAIDHAFGSVERPMTDADLEGKFMDLSRGVLSSAAARRLMALCWSVEDLPDVGAVARAAQKRAT